MDRASFSFTWTIASAGTGSAGTARHVRLEARSEVNGNPWAAVAEFNVLDASGAVIPRTGWSASADSQEVVGENAPANHAIDGDPYSIWHTQWQGGNPPMPHALSTNLGATRSIGGFKYLPRQVGANGRIAAWRFYTSNDGAAWTLASEGVFPDSAAEVTFRLPVAANLPPVLAALGDRSDTLGQVLSLALTATDANGDALTFSATGLPPGLALDAATGLVSGSPSSAGTFNVVAQVGDGRGGVAARAFAWTVVRASGASASLARYVRLEAVSEVNGNPWAAVAEFNLVDERGATLSRAGWQVAADSEEMVGESAPATHAIDGDPYTLWHTQWLGASPRMPHTLTVDLGSLQSVGGFKYLPRQIGANGLIAGWRFYTSTDGNAWLLVSQGSFGAGTAEQTERIAAGSIVNRPPSLASLPATREDALGSTHTLALDGRDADGDTLTYAASGLPTGVSINAATGVVSGTATRAETFYVTVAVSDSRGGSASRVFNWVVEAPPVATGASGINPPIVLNATPSAAAGDVVSLQGQDFGTSPRVYLDGYPGTPLEIVNRVGTGWLAVQVPASATGALNLRIDNATGTSAPVKLNTARPHHLDATELNPGGSFRLFGRNLRAAGVAPRLTVDGLDAALDLSASDEHMLSAIVPEGVASMSTATILVDNGNGSGAVRLDRSATIVASGTGDPFALGVGWGAGFAAFASRSIDPTRDMRIADKAVCDGTHDDSAAIQRAIELAAIAGGGVVQLPEGRCLAGAGLTLRSKVVLRGAGKASTELYHTTPDYPVSAVGVDLAGLSDMTLTSAVAGADGMVLKNSTRVFIKNLRIRMGTSRQMYLSDNTNFVVAGTDIEHSGNAQEQGPYTLSNAAGLVFENNSTRWVSGAPAFVRVHDSLVRANRFTRDATDQTIGGAVHSMTIDFAYRMSIIANTFDVAGGPILNKGRNDGETILTEGGGARRTENIGSVDSATLTTLTDLSQTLTMDPFGIGNIPENYGVAIVAGRGTGQMRRIVSYWSATRTATVDTPWDVTPDTSSRYATFVFGLEKTLIKGNALSQNPRGIWLYGTAMRDIDVVGNIISEGGGIYVRSYQDLAKRIFTPIYGVQINDNKITNSTGHWMSYLGAVMVNADGSAYGTGTIGIEARRNELTANRPNVFSGVEEYASVEGFMARMPLESNGVYESSASVPRLLGSLFSDNTCSHCETAVRIGTGASGTTILNTRLPGSGALLTDTSVVPSGEKSSATVAR